MDNLNLALEMIFKKFKETYGEDATLEEGEEVSCVFNDGVINVELVNGEIKIKVSAGEPFRFDYDLDLLEK